MNFEFAIGDDADNRRSIAFELETLREKIFDCAMRQEEKAREEARAEREREDGPVDAPMATLEETKAQAEELGIDFDDYVTCPCGEAFATVDMTSTPWISDNFKLYAGSNSCSLSASQSDSKKIETIQAGGSGKACLLYTSPSPRDRTRSRMPSSA